MVDTDEDDWRSDSLPSSDFARFYSAQVGDTEDLEQYKKGGLHPTHLGDLYDNDRYSIVHKLGAGGYSTVWLAHDSVSSGRVALKIVVAEKSPPFEEKAIMCQSLTSDLNDTAFGTFKRYFHIEGPNGRHLCLVQPLLGPSTYVASQFFESRMRPYLARRVTRQITKAIGDLHSRGLCHGDLTPSNVVFRLKSLDHLDEEGVYSLFGQPKTGPLETTSGEPTGPEAPKYIVGYLDFLSCTEDLLLDEISLIDLDQAFMESKPPAKTLGTPAGYLAPEVCVGQPASPASDIWALGCTLLHLRAGSSPFPTFFVDSPVDEVRSLREYLGEFPASWGEPLFNEDGYPTTDTKTGVPAAESSEEKKSLREWISKIWDEPPDCEAMHSSSEPSDFFTLESEPYPACYKDKFWKPAAIKMNGVYLSGYDDVVEAILEGLPKIPKREVDLLYDLLSKIFVYDSKDRPSASEILAHPWFHMDETRKRKRDDIEE